MKRIFLLLFVVLVFSRCNDDDAQQCSTVATIKDFTGLDGCGFVLELEDGSFIQPQLLLRCGTPPVVEDAGILLVDVTHFELVDGMRVKISYEETGDMSICMVGPVVKITCIREVSIYNPEED